MLTKPAHPKMTATTVPTTVKASVTPSNTLARAYALVRSGRRMTAGTRTEFWHSGQLTVWPAKVSSTSKRDPQEQLTNILMGTAASESFPNRELGARALQRR